MRYFKSIAFSAAAAAIFCVAPQLQAQTQVTTSTRTETVQTGTEPMCPYGYYAYKPYHCAPRGYYGPEWFDNGRFVGAGPWYHREGEFHGHVNSRYDERNGYTGPYPNRSEKYREYREDEFHGDQYRQPDGEVWHEETHETHTETH